MTSTNSVCLVVVALVIPVIINACKQPTLSAPVVGTTSPTTTAQSSANEQATTTTQNTGTSKTISTPTSTTQSATTTANQGNNVMTVTINGSLCGDAKYQYQNEPCASVTLCQHGTSNCQTINNILLDTGSSGLRVFQSLVTVPTVPVMVGTNKLGECMSYTGNSSEWGQVVYVDVKLANEPAVQVPIMLINNTFANPPTSCSASGGITVDTDPQSVGYNGILGVGLLNQDCGPTCSTSSSGSANNGMYYACSSTSCVGTTTAVQVQNPVALLPTDNNGVILQFPSVTTSGAGALTGSMILGIGTQTNNQPTNVTTLLTNADGMISTVYAASSSTSWTAFIDSGTPTLFIPPASTLTQCSASSTVAPGYYCPAALQTGTATNSDINNKIKSQVSFQVGNAETLLSSSNMVFNNIVIVLESDPNNGSDGSLCWGLPFYMGRAVFGGIEGTKSSLGTGPYYAY